MLFGLIHKLDDPSTARLRFPLPRLFSFPTPYYLAPGRTQQITMDLPTFPPRFPWSHCLEEVSPVPRDPLSLLYSDQFSLAKPDFEVAPFPICVPGTKRIFIGNGTPSTKMCETPRLLYDLSPPYLFVPSWRRGCCSAFFPRPPAGRSSRTVLIFDCPPNGGCILIDYRSRFPFFCRSFFFPFILYLLKTYVQIFSAPPASGSADAAAAVLFIDELTSRPLRSSLLSFATRGAVPSVLWRLRTRSWALLVSTVTVRFFLNTPVFLPLPALSN